MKEEAEGEDFRSILGFPRYFIGNQGSVYSSIRRGRFLQWHVSTAGYPYVDLMQGKVARKFSIHRLVAMAFIPNHINLPIVNHKNGIKLDADWRNLEWCDYSYNNDHALRAGLNPALGETHYCARLTEGDIRNIRSLANLGVFHRVIATQYGIGRKAVTKIVNGQRWGHVR